jgi:hypothetical protein
MRQQTPKGLKQMDSKPQDQLVAEKIDYLFRQMEESEIKKGKEMVKATAQQVYSSKRLKKGLRL